MKQSKQKGNLGFSSTIKELHKLGLNVFSEIGDNSRIDLIVEYKFKLIKIQVKYVTEKNGCVKLKVTKSGPNGYRYKYLKDDVDIFAVYYPILDKVIFVPSYLACEKNRQLTIRHAPTKNNQFKNVHHISEFEDLEKILMVISEGF